MSSKSALDSLSGSELLALLKKKKGQLITEKKILDKKVATVYPLNSSPFEIPANWTWCYLSDVSIIQEGPGIRKHQYSQSGVQFLTVTNILEGDVDLEKSKKHISLEQYKNYAHFTVNKGDIVTACSGGSWGKSAIYDLDAKIILNTSTLRLRFFGDLGDNRYLYYLTKTSYFKESLSIHTTGQQPNYGYFHYSKIPIPLPPLREQKHIVEILDETFAAIDKAKANIEKNLQNAKELFEAKKAYSFARIAYANKIAVSNVCSEIFAGGDAPKENFSPIKTEQYKVPIIANAVENNGLYGYTNFARVKEPSITIAARGSGTGHTEIRLEPFLPIVRLIVMIPKTEMIDLKFLMYSVQNLKIVRSGSAIPQLTVPMIKGYEINVPEISLQKELVTQLDFLKIDIERIEIVYKQKLSVLEELKKSILQKAFTGELTAKALTTVDED